MEECILHLGSNLGNPKHNLGIAELMISKRIGVIIQKSAIYYTEPWGNENQDYFLNMAVKVYTDRSPELILNAIKKIEQKMGRRKAEKWGPRIIDIDIIFYGQRIIKNDHLIIPHPELSNRNFVLIPLVDICPKMKHPERNKTVYEIFLESKDNGIVREWNK